MKKIIASLVFIALSFSHLFCQNEIVLNNVIQQELFKKNSDEFFCIHPSPNIDDVGRISIFNGEINNYEYRYYTGGGFNGVFYTQNNLPVFLMTFGVDLLAQGLVKFEDDWSFDVIYPVGVPEYISHGVELSNGNFVLGESWSLFGLDSIYEKNWEAPLNGEIRDLYVLENDTLFVFTENEATLISPDGEIIQSYPELIFEKPTSLNDSGWAGIRNDSLYFISPSFILENRVELPNEEVFDLEYANGNITILTEQHNIYIYNDGLELMNNFLLSGNDLLSFSNFELSDDGILIMGSSSRGTFIKKYGWDGTDLYTENNDIGIVS
jgi:hypothetical protein